MEFSKDEINMMTKLLMKAINSSESEWMNMEKAILENYQINKNDNASSTILQMWNQLHRKVEGSINRMKNI